MTTVLDRFLRYIKIDTQSQHDATTYPSTAKQLNLARLLKDELLALGLTDAQMDQYGYVTATLPANTDKKLPVVGLLAHMDTSPDFSGENVKPQFVKYEGGALVLNEEKNIVMDPAIFTDLSLYIGKTLITTDGTTLLGADDKAGVAEIMAAVEYLLAHPEIKHGTIKIGFTPDEEVGTGVEYFDVQKFGADFAYTLDGGEAGELEYETFNAATATVLVHGQNVNPGKAKGKMINAALDGMELNDLLPVFERPEYTDDYEGFYHLHSMEGSVELTKLIYIIRDHDMTKFEAKKALMRQAAAYINQKYAADLVELKLEDSYYNMAEKITPHPEIMAVARRAIEAAGLPVITKPVRGGTDGSRLSFMGLPTPNIFTGGHYAHGKFEFIPEFALEKAVEVVVNIAKMLAE